MNCLYIFPNKPHFTFSNQSTQMASKDFSVNLVETITEVLLPRKNRLNINEAK